MAQQTEKNISELPLKQNNYTHTTLIVGLPEFLYVMGPEKPGIVCVMGL